MTDIPLILHYTSIAAIAGLTTIGAGIGGGKATIDALEAIDIQPNAKTEIMRASIMGLALIETSAILALITMFLLFASPVPKTLAPALAECGIAFAMGITGFVVGIVSSLPVAQTSLSIARQPFFSQKIVNLMLITQSIIQTPLIFAFLIALLINFQITSVTTITQGVILLSSGLCLGLGAIGPAIGLARFAATACKSISINRAAYNQIIGFTFMSQAIIETPIIFAFLIALLLMGTSPSNGSNLMIVRALCAALCMGIGTFSPGINSSATASAACPYIALNPQHYSILSQVSMLGQGLIDAAAIYALLISILLVFMQ